MFSIELDEVRQMIREIIHERCNRIRLLWQDAQMKVHIVTPDGFQAQIVRHEVDYCGGILI